MKIKFKKKRLFAHLIIGIIWMLLGIASLFFGDALGWTIYGYAVIGLLYIGHYLHDWTNQYLTIENGTIKKNGLYGFSKKINLNDINWIKKFAGDYTLKTQNKELKIDTNLIDEQSLVELNKILGSINLPPDKTPFHPNDLITTRHKN